MSIVVYPDCWSVSAKMTSSRGKGSQPARRNVYLPVKRSLLWGIVGNDAMYALSKTIDVRANASKFSVWIQSFHNNLDNPVEKYQLLFE